MTKSKKFRVKQVAPQYPSTWGATEFFYWDQELNDILKQDVDGSLFNAAYDSVDWGKYFERLKGTPFENREEEGSILTFGGPAHIERTNPSRSRGDCLTKSSRMNTDEHG